MGYFSQYPYNLHELNLNWILDRMRLYEGSFDSLKNEIYAFVQNELNATDTEFSALRKEFDKLASGAYIEDYIKAMTSWLDNNLQCMVSRIVKYVFFGLTSDGHFCAWIPDTWDFLHFDTDMDSTSPTYGHLILRW